MPDCRLICATPTPHANLGGEWDLIVQLPPKVNGGILCLERARFNVSWATQAQHPFIFADPDIEFKSRPPIESLSDINLIWRKGKADQPINAGIVVAKPGPREFWLQYGRAALNLPDLLHSWWCDQLAYNLMTGICHEAGDIFQCADATVQLMDGAIYCPNSDATIPQEAWAIHYKGGRKGPGWDKVYVPKSKSGGGKSWPGSVSSTGIVAGLSLASPPDDSHSTCVPIFPISP